MASKYLQKYPVPEGFYEILHDFTREILRAQPEDIIYFAANYFEQKAQGKEYIYESKYNVPKPVDKYDMANKKSYNPTPHEQYADQAMKVVEASNNKENDLQKLNSQKSDKQNDLSNHSKESDISFAEEKRISKQFVQDMYNSAMLKAAGTESVQEIKSIQEDKSQQEIKSQQEVQSQQEVIIQQKEEIKLDGPIESYQNAALKIQAKFRGDQVRNKYN
ncbi:regulatory subunit of type ii pka r-subunit family protein, putative [Ichthyophthirius multifiliis]|uniref:Regulatory subunit of type ii pka r-subunit family protein, putative n=1 Tax=Ichthyophthirius multifiliis TaxID=5932 RepID=G0QPG4_ICHMU|nr:regulatory subunit of type ii pka r-subunit family protein, putative [Ichthyophthirius multifiliis]EGR32891.1 regulatory subunit of type ii pka r-subunit family protein, putative [Ichthyophthirius multifiliis]|eukprot:XP_004036877.1 regulatory subunit of type ii pka r-subunit family protein, putative [Ichthyophthirius multifiliis]